MDRREPRRNFGHAVLGLSGILSAYALLASCTSAEPETKYGDPAGVRKDNLPGEAGVEVIACGDAGISEDAQADGCAVSWRANLFPRMRPGDGGWECANSSCHGPGSKELPNIPLDPAAALTSLKAYALPTRAADPYINDKSQDPAKSTITCNLSNSCGVPMPIGVGRPLTNTERCQLQAWLTCGAPNN